MNLIFEGYIGSQNQFIQLDFLNLIFQKLNADQQGESVAWLYFAFWLDENLESGCSSAYEKLTVYQINLQNSVNGLSLTLIFARFSICSNLKLI